MKIKRNLKEFDEIFETNTLRSIDLKDVPLINNILETFKDRIYKPSLPIQELNQKKNKILEDLINMLSSKQLQLFNQYLELQNEIDSEFQKQLFLNGFIFSKEIDIEIKSWRKSRNDFKYRI